MRWALRGLSACLLIARSLELQSCVLSVASSAAGFSSPFVHPSRYSSSAPSSASSVVVSTSTSLRATREESSKVAPEEVQKRKVPIAMVREVDAMPAQDNATDVRMGHPFLRKSKPSDLDLIFLGTASCNPTYTRGTSCTALKIKWKAASTWIFDAGEGTQLQVRKLENPSFFRFSAFLSLSLLYSAREAHPFPDPEPN